MEYTIYYHSILDKFVIGREHIEGYNLYFDPPTKTWNDTAKTWLPLNELLLAYKEETGNTNHNFKFWVAYLPGYTTPYRD
jgi:hypothetical protein